MLLKAKLTEKEAVTFEDGVYWTKKEDGTKDGPFCARCRDKDGKNCRMKKEEYIFRCLTCDQCIFHTEPPAPDTAETRESLFGPGAW